MLNFRLYLLDEQCPGKLLYIKGVFGLMQSQSFMLSLEAQSGSIVQIPTTITGERNCTMLKPLDNDEIINNIDERCNISSSKIMKSCFKWSSWLLMKLLQFNHQW
jgi:hypothetical protein